MAATYRLPEIMRELGDDAEIEALGGQIADDLANCARRLRADDAGPGKRREILHELRGVALTLRAARLVTLCREAEAALTRAPDAGMDDLAAHICDLTDMLATSVRAETSRNRPGRPA